ncbi:MAG: hypothetical protein H6642_18645 [Caldilineaceae bacterium]|nr:hypothetical protein [Caldilineaceae bacterium]
MPQREYSKEQCKVSKTNPRVILPIAYGEYQEIASDSKRFRRWLDEMSGAYPELFPYEIEAGYRLHDFLPPSVKLPDVRFRRIKLKAGEQQVLTICSSDVMPYMTGYTDEVEKALFLRRFGVPFWALTYLFGHNDDYWYNMTVRFGRYEIVGTVVKDTEQMPTDLLADEKHVHFNGEKGYIAMTVGADCVLGASLALAADQEALTDAYGYFKDEAQRRDPEYQPQTVNTDGWFATRNAWQALFSTITVIQCFLHAFLKIRDRTKRRFKELYADIQQQVWDVYHATDPQEFFRLMADFQQWANQTLTGPALDAVHKLCAKADDFALAFDHPTAYRTSNMVDRHMIPLDRWLSASRHFHGDWRSAELHIRAWVLFHDFMPYCPRAKIRERAISPAHQLNGFTYHENWLYNLLVSTSCAGFITNHRKC